MQIAMLVKTCHVNMAKKAQTVEGLGGTGLLLPCFIHNSQLPSCAMRQLCFCHCAILLPSGETKSRSTAVAMCVQYCHGSSQQSFLKHASLKTS